MAAVKTMDMTVPFTLKQEEEAIQDIINDDASLNELDKILSMPLPPVSGRNFLLPSTKNHEFLRLTAMVRAVYFSYLHKCLLSNYIVCYKQKSEESLNNSLKNCADQMELNAVRYSLEVSLYRQHMIEMISDIKSHTSQKKIYKQLVMFLETPSNKVDAAVQTNSLSFEKVPCDQYKSNTVPDVYITSNCTEISNKEETLPVDEKVCCTEESNAPLICEKVNESLNVSTAPLTAPLKNEDANKLQIFDEQSQETMILTQMLPVDSSIQQSMETVCNDDDNSQDSLFQHMEDMFCESDDSSDLTTLIEKHSGISKASVDKEISKMSLEADNSLIPNLKPIPESNKVLKSSTVKMSNPAQGKFSFSYYKEMKSRVEKPMELNEEDIAEDKQETTESKQKKRAAGIWFVERVHQVSKLKAKMTELSLTNYRKYGTVKEKFIELFGGSDDEDMMPDSPICIEEHITACKERIAPWIVKYLMPFYKKRRIKDRQLFKAVAKHIADMLIIENTFPEENCIKEYTVNYFRNKKFIKTSHDIYM